MQNQSTKLNTTQCQKPPVRAVRHDRHHVKQIRAVAVRVLRPQHKAHVSRAVLIFQQLFWLADHKYGGSLPVPVHFLMDEFANETQL